MGVSEPSYTFRASPFARSRRYQLNPNDFEWRDGRGGGRTAYKDIVRVEVCKERFLGSSSSYWRCVLYPKSGGKIRLGAASRCGLRRIEDLTATDDEARRVRERYPCLAGQPRNERQSVRC
jgi:hypothetical protein